jgi:hypothetical protein
MRHTKLLAFSDVDVESERRAIFVSPLTPDSVDESRIEQLQARKAEEEGQTHAIGEIDTRVKELAFESRDKGPHPAAPLRV